MSQSLIDSFPNTMLARMVSNEWKNDDDDDDEEIFIERDGSKFSLVLDYMRDGKVHLPFTTSKAAMLDELSYYCFDDIDPDVVIDDVVYLHRGYQYLLDKTDETFQKLSEKRTNLEQDVNDVKFVEEVLTAYKSCSFQTELKFAMKDWSVDGESEEFVSAPPENWSVDGRNSRNGVQSTKFVRAPTHIDYCNELLKDLGIAITSATVQQEGYGSDRKLMGTVSLKRLEPLEYSTSSSGSSSSSSKRRRY